MALLLAVLEPLVSVSRHEVASVHILTDKQSAWCIQTSMESTMYARFIHGLELTCSALIGQTVLFIVALVVNNIGPASRKYPVQW